MVSHSCIFHVISHFSQIILAPIQKFLKKIVLAKYFRILGLWFHIAVFSMLFLILLKSF